MSGQESAYSFDNWDMNPSDLADFTSSNSSYADILNRGLKSKIVTREDGSRLDAGGGIYYDRNLHPLSVSESRQAAQAYAAFNNWVTDRNKANADHETYVKMKNDLGPGRDATIIGFNQEKQGTIIGEKLPYARTVLG
jgi:hypothetical protein